MFTKDDRMLARTEIQMIADAIIDGQKRLDTVLQRLLVKLDESQVAEAFEKEQLIGYLNDAGCLMSYARMALELAHKAT